MVSLLGFHYCGFIDRLAAAGAGNFYEFHPGA
jgi:hypothetical protein